MRKLELEILKLEKKQRVIAEKISLLKGQRQIECVGHPFKKGCGSSKSISDSIIIQHTGIDCDSDSFDYNDYEYICPDCGLVSRYSKGLVTKEQFESVVENLYRFNRIEKLCVDYNRGDDKVNFYSKLGGKEWQKR